jgi:hypothetical protein
MISVSAAVFSYHQVNIIVLEAFFNPATAVNLPDPCVHVWVRHTYYCCNCMLPCMALMLSSQSSRHAYMAAVHIRKISLLDMQLR